MKTLILLLVSIPLFLGAQNKPGTQLHVKRATEKIVLDGVIDEQSWQTADVAKNWFQNYPVDTVISKFQTEARVTFDEHFFYVSYVAYDDTTRDMINLLRRDFDYMMNDNIGLNLGPYNDRINGFFFVLTPRGIQMEGTISAGGASNDSYSASWDNKWYSKVVRYKDKWVAEAAIPFKSFRYKSGIREWNIAFDRFDKKRNGRSSWIRTPIQFPTGSFAYSGQLIWDDPIPPAHTNISLIPFIAGRAAADNEADPKTSSFENQVGFDAKVSITPSLNLDLTANPDFSQVEVDQQVINLTRFEFMFPERRQFFLENSDLMAAAGFPPARTFFSRRIGLIKDSSGLYTRVPIAFGARLSGSINSKWRIGLLNMQTKEKRSVGLPTQNYSVFTLQRNFWKQSNFTITYADKESLHLNPGDSSKYFHESVFKPVSVNGSMTKMPNRYNRVVTADLELLSANNKWYSSAYASHSFDPFQKDQQMSIGGFGSYSVRKGSVNAGTYIINKNYNAEMGFVPSYGVYPGLIAVFTEGQFKMYPKNTGMVWMGPKLNIQHNYVPSGTVTDKTYSFTYDIRLLNTGVIQIGYNHIYQRLTNTFNPIDAEKFTTFNAGEVYQWNNVVLAVQTNSRRLINFTGQTTYGGFYNGTNLNVNGQLNFRYQPYANLSMRFDYNDLKLEAGYGKEKLFLVGPRIDVTFTDKLFLTTFVQYNNLIDNMNINARFQWRYKPASDFFIVYTENYFAGSLASKNRALVFKLTYWFNL